MPCDSSPIPHIGYAPSISKGKPIQTLLTSLSLSKKKGNTNRKPQNYPLHRLSAWLLYAPLCREIGVRVSKTGEIVYFISILLCKIFFKSQREHSCLVKQLYGTRTVPDL